MLWHMKRFHGKHGQVSRSPEPGAVAVRERTTALFPSTADVAFHRFDSHPIADLELHSATFLHHLGHYLVLWRTVRMAPMSDGNSS